MGQMVSASRHHKHNATDPPLRRDLREADIRAIVEENARLRDLVVQLSKLIVTNVVENKSGRGHPLLDRRRNAAVGYRGRQAGGEPR
jgi:hypothetical protein